MRILALLLSFLTTIPVTGLAAGTPPIKAPEAIVVDAGSGEVLFEKNASSQRAPASMTKLMTLYLLAGALEKGRVHLGDRVPVSLRAFKTGGAQIWLEPGEALPLSQLLRAIAIGSANDACVAVGEFIAGSEGAFVARMNETAKALGMKDTHFMNPHGLDDPRHVTSARDLAILARAVLKKPMVVKALTQKEDRTIRNGKGGTLWLVNHNKLLWRYPGILGLKTGYTNQAGFCLTSAARRDGMTVIAVVMGDPTSKERFDDAAALMNWAFETHESRLVLPRGRVLGRVGVERGTLPEVSAVTPEDVRVTVTRGAKDKPKVGVVLPRNVRAPVPAGAALGHVNVEIGATRVRMPLVAHRGVPCTSFGNTFLRLLRGALQVQV